VKRCLQPAIAVLFAIGVLVSVPTGVIADDAGPDYEESDEEIDYWEGIEFDSSDFSKVRDIIASYYIDPGYDKRLAWVTAADYMLLSMKPARTILPERYFKKAAEYKGAEFVKLTPSDRFVITVKPEGEDRNYAAMTDEQLEVEKLRIRTTIEEREKQWRSIDFSEDDFERVHAWVVEQESSRPVFNESSTWIAAATGYLASLDPHTSVLSSKAWDENTKETEDGSFEGIGAQLTTSQGRIIIESPMEGQPADTAGIKAGDEIVEVDGRRVLGMALTKVVKLIKGPKGTPVVLTIRRRGVPQDVDFTIIRQHIEIKNIQWRLLKDHPDIGYLKITGFVDGTAANVEKAIQALIGKTKGGRLRGLVIDLRMNSGGLLDESVKIADAFLEGGNIVSVKSPSEKDESYNAAPGSWTFPIVVLVNSGSASASEILASAIQENGRGLVIGDRTFGKASVQTLVPPYPRTDYVVKVTIARYYAPSGRTIQVSGVVPDISTPPEVDGKQPIGFREEDLVHHLTLIENEYTSPNVARVKSLSKCVGRMGTAEASGRANPHPTIKFDFQLATAVDYLECMWLEESHNVKLGRPHAGR